MKLGKKPFVPDSRDIRLTALLSATKTALPKAPARFGHAGAFRDWGSLGNDRYGDCVFAGAAHETMLTGVLAHKRVHFNDDTVLGDYAALTGFNAADPSSDQGTNVRQALGYRRNVGIVDYQGNRHKIGAYVSIDPKDWELMLAAVWLFSAVGIGFEVPHSCFDQFNHHQPWDVVPGEPIDGGHYVPVMGRGGLTSCGTITWGRRQSMTQSFYETYCDEAWAIVYPEELRAGVNERGYKLDALNRALAAL